MSKSLENQITWLKDLSSRMRGIHSDDICFSMSNRKRWTDAYTLWVGMLADALSNSDVCRLAKDDALLSLFAKGSKCMSSMKQLLLFLRVFTLREGASYRNIKRSYLHRWKDAAELFELLEPLLRKFFVAPSAPSFLPLNDLLSFLGRLTLENPLLEIAAIDKFIADDQIVITATDEEIEAVACIIQDWVGEFQPDLSYGYHGPGASFGIPRRDAYPDSKFQTLRMTPLLRYAGAGSRKCDNSPAPLLAVEGSLLPDGPDEPSRIVFVPKSADSLRTICTIPAWKMFWQKSVQMQLYSYIESSPLVRHISFSRQELSQRLCLRGSRDRSYYTIDLSAASDTVSWVIVKKVFRKTNLLRILFATRSKQYVIRKDGVDVELTPNKFDPMGSALTFPIESLLFAAVCESTAVRRNPRYRVYGDDIVCHPNDIPADMLIAKLQRFGFRVNITKSYTTGPFREACGCEAYDGLDVSPIRLSRKWRCLSPKSPDDVAGLRELANGFLLRGYRLARLLVVRQVLSTRYARFMRFDVPCTENRWWSFQATNYTGRTRWNIHLQRAEWPNLVTRNKRARGDPHSGCYQWFAQRYWESVVRPQITQREWCGEITQALSGTGKLREKVLTEWLPV